MILNIKSNRGRNSANYEFDEQNKLDCIKLMKIKEISNYTSALKLLSKWEFKHSKPFYEIPREVLANTIKQSELGYLTKRSYNATLNIYANWIMKTNSDTTKYFTTLWEDFNIEKELIHIEASKSFIATSEELFDLLEVIHIKVREKVVISLLYEGFTLLQIFNFKTTDCRDINSNKITCEDTTYEIDKKTASYIQTSLSMTHDDKRNIDFSEHDKYYLFKRLRYAKSKRDIQTAQTDITRVNKRLKKLNRNLTVDITKLRLGRFYQMLYNIERNTNIPFTKHTISSEIFKYRIINSDVCSPARTDDIYKLYLAFKDIYADTINLTPAKPISTLMGIINQHIVNNDICKDPKQIPLKLEQPDDSANINPIGRGKINRGIIGEAYITSILQAQYPNSKIYKVSDSCGFDLQMAMNSMPKLDIEVKVVHKFNDTINLTLHELETADIYRKGYVIYIVSLPFGDDTSKASYTVINNPVQTLGINYNEIITSFNIPYDKCDVSCNSITIRNWYHKD